MGDNDIKRKDIPKSNKELNELFTLVVNKIKFINENYDKIESSSHLQELQDAYEEIYGKNDGNGNVVEKGKLKELQEAYSEILEDDEENENYSLKSQIESLLEDIDVDKKKINDFIIKVEGEYGKNEAGEKIKIKEGYFNRIEKQIEKFDDLYNEIDTRLKDGSTSVELAGVYEKKVKKYYEQSVLRQFIFIMAIFLGLFFTFNLFGTFTNWNNFLAEFLGHIPFFILFVWLMIFISNRSAESTKLEESYIHKEVMARAYVGYKKSILELSNDDNKLLEKHMENLLNAMSVDSSEFLSSKGENHPLIDLFNNVLKKDIKDIFPEGELNFPGGKVTFKK